MRTKQKGIMCRVVGCDNWCKTKGLCSKHGMALRRYGNVLGGKIDRKGVCVECGEEFRRIKSSQVYCSFVCYRKSLKGRKAAYEATKAYRGRNKERVNARGIFRRHPIKADDSN